MTGTTNGAAIPTATYIAVVPAVRTDKLLPSSRTFSRPTLVAAGIRTVAKACGTRLSGVVKRLATLNAPVAAAVDIDATMRTSRFLAWAPIELIQYGNET